MRKIGKSIVVFLMLGIMVFSLCACKHAKITKIVEIGTEIDTINPTDVGSSEHLLSALDTLNAEVKTFSELNPPSELKDAKERAESASKLMNEAVTDFHTALGGETVDQNALDTARFNYGNAIIEIKNVGIALQNVN